MAKTIDPTRTTLLRASFAREIQRRFSALASAVYQLVGVDDAFGLSEPTLQAVHSVAATLNADRQVWRFQTSDEKVASFRKWFQEQFEKLVLPSDPQTGKPWTSKYAEAAYKKGVLRAISDSLRAGVRPKTLFGTGSTQDRLASGVMWSAERNGMLKLLATRSFEDLKGISQDAALRMNRILSTSILTGTNPRQVASQLRREIQNLSRARAERIARTEIIHAHAEGQLDSFEELGVEKLGVLAEWSTAKDDRVCPLCKPLDGAVFTVAQARGMIPRHPNCRCCWIPAPDSTKQDRKKSLGKLRKSLDAQGGPDRSSWVGRLRLKAADLHRKKGTPPKKKKRRNA